MSPNFVIEHDPQADAIYIRLSSKLYSFGEDLDSERRIDYAADHTPMGIELLCVSVGVNVDGLPRSDEVVKALKKRGIPVIGQNTMMERTEGTHP